MSLVGMYSSAASLAAIRQSAPSVEPLSNDDDDGWRPLRKSLTLNRSRTG
ncbi:hypothetical protein ZOD2009_08848 [Haladaptatus paucihalophilus DX253]|uniref:Uncharacterized protein n=1 Tax=Haladaptatus paucihalophilus DX253 TaxID=797209 RepID=E7QSJ4_HALPU|nr:hypothetical protein ZOD2009_08848 [Haladaptatus paucihalophilus DX253]